MKWNYTNKEGKTEEVELQRWVWGALYKDSSELHQFDELGNFHQIGEIVQENVALWVLYEHEGKGRIDFIVPDGAKLIHKYIGARLDFGGPTDRKVFVTVFGYKYKGVHSLTYILPDNRMIQATTDNIDLSAFNI